VSTRPSIDARIRRYYVFDMLVGFQIWTPFWTLWLLNHANEFQATLVDIVFWTTSLLLTIPAGAIADRYGRRPAILVGVAVWVSGIVLFGLANSLPMFALGNAVWAIGAAFMWGTVSAYLYDTLAEAGMESRYPAITSRGTMLTFISAAAAAPLGGYLVQVSGGLNLPLLVYALPGALALVVATTFPEPSVHRVPEANLVAQMRSGLRTTRGHPQIVLIIVFQILIGVVTYIIAFFRPLFIEEIVGGNFALIGIAYGGFFCVAAAAGRSFDRLLDRFGESGALWLTFFLVFPPMILVYAVSAGVFSSTAGIVAGVTSQIPYYVIWGFEGPIVTTIINRRVLSNDRATVLAISIFFTTLSLAIFEPIVGYVITVVGLGTSLALLAAVAVVPSAYVIAAFRRSGAREIVPRPVPTGDHER